MNRNVSRSQLMKRLGAKPQNSDGGWCTVNEPDKKVFLSIWTDSRDRRPGDKEVSYLVQEPDWGICSHTGEKSQARKRHDDNLQKVFDEGYGAYGYFVVPDQATGGERQVKETKTSFIFSFELAKKDDGTVVGYPRYRLDM
jgi:hypothetical protein